MLFDQQYVVASTLRSKRRRLFFDGQMKQASIFRFSHDHSRETHLRGSGFVHQAPFLHSRGAALGFGGLALWFA